MSNIITIESNSQEFNREIVGGKGEYLLRLAQASNQLKSFEVPRFYIIPSDYSNANPETLLQFFNSLKHPVAVRSSSPLEEGINASFAGLFGSFLDVSTFTDFQQAYQKVKDSANSDFVQRYAERMNVPFDSRMAVIVQEQVVNPWLRGTIQLDDENDWDASFRCEFTDREGKPDNYDLKFEYMQDFGNPTHKPRANPEFISEGDYWVLAHAAREARKNLGLEGVVQVEACFSPDKPISFVQIRTLPTVRSYAAELDMDVPKGIPYVESTVCNDVAGELVLPAYVTVSQSGLKRILVETGQSFIMGLGSGDERAENFEQNSKLAQNPDYQHFRDLVPLERFEGLERMLPHYNEAWKRGNSFFDDYILVCDKLDETISEMADATTNKRAIITCHEAKKTSHAMTVARDLGIMCMGVDGDLYDLEPKLFHQVETGDLIHMKSDGKRAVAYIEKKRVVDPYIK